MEADDTGVAPSSYVTIEEDGSRPLTGENIAKAIGAYERTLVRPSPIDRYLSGDVNALSPKAHGGLATFINTGCVKPKIKRRLALITDR